MSAWGQFVESHRGPQIVLVDGSLLVAENVTLDGRQLVAESTLFGKVTLPIEAVAGVVVHPPADPGRRDALLASLTSASLASEEAGGDRGWLDRVWLDNADQLLGKLVDWRGGKVAIETDAGRVELDVAQVTAIQLQPGPAEPAAPPAQARLTVGWRDGSRLTADRLVTEAKTARLTLAAAPTVTLTAETASISGLAARGGQAVYLSDLSPAGYKHIPFLQLAWRYRTDKNAAGELLRAGGNLYLKGLGMHSASRLTYDLERPARSFEAALAVDERSGGRGSVVFRVFVDTGDGRWEPKYSSPIVRGGDPPLPISVDVARAKRISLLVEFADRGDELDYADWLDARLIP